MNTSELSQAPFQCQSIIATEEIGSKVDAQFTQDSKQTLTLEENSQLTFHVKNEQSEEEKNSVIL